MAETRALRTGEEIECVWCGFTCRPPTMVQLRRFGDDVVGQCARCVNAYEMEGHAGLVARITTCRPVNPIQAFP